MAGDTGYLGCIQPKATSSSVLGGEEVGCCPRGRSASSFPLIRTLAFLLRTGVQDAVEQQRAAQSSGGQTGTMSGRAKGRVYH